MTSAAALISCRVMSLPPMMLKTIPVALSMGESRSGDEMAAVAASSALVFPLPVPMPMRAVPALPITLRTSAKSTLMSPVFCVLCFVWGGG